MCFKVKTPKVENPEVPATQLVPSTENKLPDSPTFGDTESIVKRRKGKDALKLKLTSGNGGGGTGLNL